MYLAVTSGLHGGRLAGTTCVGSNQWSAWREVSRDHLCWQQPVVCMEGGQQGPPVLAATSGLHGGRSAGTTCVGSNQWSAWREVSGDHLCWQQPVVCMEGGQRGPPVLAATSGLHGGRSAGTTCVGSDQWSAWREVSGDHLCWQQPVVCMEGGQQGPSVVCQDTCITEFDLLIIFHRELWSNRI